MNVESDRMFFLRMMVRAGFSAHYHGDNIAVFAPTGLEPVNEPSIPEEREREEWDYLESEPAEDAPPNDNPSGMYCPSCRNTGVMHCGQPEWCGGMRLMAENK